MANTKAAAGGVAANSNFLQLLKSEIASQLSTNFTQLGSHPRAADYVLGVIGTESGMGFSWKNVSIKHAVLSGTSGIGKAYEQHPIIVNARKSVVIDQTNVTQGRQAHSLMGALGAYLIRGLQSGAKSFPHVQGKYKEIAEGIGCLVEPGQSISSLFTEDLAGLKRGLVPGLCILEYNYSNCLKKYGGDKDKAVYQAIRLHLGDPNAADSVTGISSSDYLAKVMNTSNQTSGASGGSKIYNAISQNTTRYTPETSGVTAKGSAPGCTFAS